MEILFLCKRRPQNRDLIERPYGRFYNLPKYIAAMGHKVTMLLGSYQSEPPEEIQIDGMTIYSERMFPNLVKFYLHAKKLARAKKPDVVVCFSDTWFGVIGSSVAKASGAALVIDAYDNYEAYIPWAKPLHWLWRHSLRRADALTAAGPQLLERLTEFNNQAVTTVIPMAADELFKPMSMGDCREELQLPISKKLLGCAGSLDSSRGTDVFSRAVKILFTERDDVDLVISGRERLQIDIPLERVHALGYVSDELVPLVLNSCDILVAVNQDSEFGRYSYPVKIYEAIACKKPIVATDTLPARWILNNDERFLAPFEDAKALASRISDLLDNSVEMKETKGGWKKSAMIFNGILKSL